MGRSYPQWLYWRRFPDRPAGEPDLRQKIALHVTAIEWALLLGAMLAAGCATQRYHPAPIAAEQTAAAVTARTLDDSGLRAFAEPVYGPAAGAAAAEARRRAGG